MKYLDDWESSVQNNDKIPKEAKPYCTLPYQTVEGLKICGRSYHLVLHNYTIYNLAYSLPEIMKVLLSHEEVKFVYTVKFNQDTAEAYFGQQRARGQRNDNPSVNQFLENAQALMVQKSLAIGGSSSISRKRGTPDLSPLCRPLPKRRRTRIDFTPS